MDIFVNIVAPLLSAIIGSFVVVGGAWWLYKKKVQDKTEYIHNIKKYMDEKDSMLRFWCYQSLMAENDYLRMKRNGGYPTLSQSDFMHLFDRMMQPINSRDMKNEQKMIDGLLNTFYKANIYKTNEMKIIFANILYQKYSRIQHSILVDKKLHKEYQEMLKEEMEH